MNSSIYGSYGTSSLVRHTDTFEFDDDIFACEILGKLTSHTSSSIEIQTVWRKNLMFVIIPKRAAFAKLDLDWTTTKTVVSKF